MRIPVITLATLVLSLFAFSASALVIVDEYTTDFIILYSAGYYLSIDRHPGTLGTFARPQWAVLVDNEPVYLVAHGAPGRIGANDEMDGADLARWIGAPQWYTTRIYAVSCASAVNDREGRSLIAAAADASRSTRTFIGYAGCTITDAAAGGERVVLPAKVGTMQEIQDDLVRRRDPQREIERFIAAYRRDHGAMPSLLELAQYAFGNATIRQFFTDLLQRGQREGCFYQPGQGVVEKQGKR